MEKEQGWTKQADLPRFRWECVSLGCVTKLESRLYLITPCNYSSASCNLQPQGNCFELLKSLCCQQRRAMRVVTQILQNYKHSAACLVVRNEAPVAMAAECVAAVRPTECGGQSGEHVSVRAICRNESKNSFADPGLCSCAVQ